MSDGPDGHAGAEPDDEARALIDRVRAVALASAERAGEIDRMRAFPGDLFDRLEQTGIFAALTPKARGGPGLALPVLMRAISEGARGNGSLGWLMMVGVSNSIGPALTSETAAPMPERMRMRIRGSIAPRGIAIPVEGGYRVTGRWPFASGGPDPEAMSGVCIVQREDGAPSGRGGPDMIFARMSPADLERIDNWHVLGLRGTDSCDYAARDLFVPEENCRSVSGAKLGNDGSALSLLPVRVAFAPGHAAVAIGIAQGALDDIVDLARTKRPAMGATAILADDPVFRHQLGEHSLRLTACRAMLDQVVTDALQEAAELRELSPLQTVSVRSSAAYITQECVKVVDWAFTAAGSNAVYDGSALQRRFRDIHIATQHAASRPDPYRAVGAALLGEALPPHELF